MCLSARKPGFGTYLCLVLLYPDEFLVLNIDDVNYASCIQVDDMNME